jgi:hypothetical protein
LWLAERHIRVDLASGVEKKLDTRHSIFVGNLPFDVEDEDLWSAFGPCGTVQRVRVVRDAKSNMGKGFAYVQARASNPSFPPFCTHAHAYMRVRTRTPRCVRASWADGLQLVLPLFCSLLIQSS